MTSPRSLTDNLLKVAGERINTVIVLSFISSKLLPSAVRQSASPIASVKKKKKKKRTAIKHTKRESDCHGNERDNGGGDGGGGGQNLERQTDRQTDRQTNKQTDGRTDRDRQTDR